MLQPDWQAELMERTLAKNKARLVMMNQGKAEEPQPSADAQSATQDVPARITIAAQWHRYDGVVVKSIHTPYAADAGPGKSYYLEEVAGAVSAIEKILPNAVQVVSVSRDQSEDGCTMFAIKVKEERLKELCSMDSRDRVLLDLMRAGNALLSSLETLIDEGSGQYERLVAKEREEWKRARDKVFDEGGEQDVQTEEQMD